MSDNFQTEGFTSNIDQEWIVASSDYETNEIHEYAESVRQYYYSQVELIRNIPYLALIIQDHNCFHSEFVRAYEHCLWGIHLENESYGECDLFLELRTGMLIDAETACNLMSRSSETTVIKPASDYCVFTKFNNIEEYRRFVPADLIRYMMENIKVYGKVKIDKQRQEWKKMLDVKMNE